MGPVEAPARRRGRLIHTCVNFARVRAGGFEATGHNKRRGGQSQEDALRFLRVGLGEKPPKSSVSVKPRLRDCG